MEERSVTHSTFVIERSYPTTPERVFAAFADPAKKRRWFAEKGEGFEVEEFEADFRISGYERTRFRAKNGPLTGTVFANDTSYHDIVTNRRVVLACTMSVGDKRISASLISFEFLPTGKGTDLIFTEQVAFFEGAEGLQIREGRWRQLFDQLEKELMR